MIVTLETNLPAFAGDLAEEIRLFFPVRKVEMGEKSEEGLFLQHRFWKEGENFFHACCLWADGKEVAQYQGQTPAVPEEDVLLFKKICKRGAKQSAFRCMAAFAKKEMPWGSLTGVRPSKLFREMAEEKGLEEAKHCLGETFDCSKEKIALLEQIYQTQKPVFAELSETQADLYLHIPFCPSKCAYCSFPSGVISKDGALEDAYLDALLQELALADDLWKKYQLRAIYIGGGTPTSLSEKQLARILQPLGKFAPLEFTIEAGRPDTITQEKLALFQECGVTRVSVNAQTTNDETLRRIGRNHLATDFFRAYDLAKTFGFQVNTDLIVGLPGENPEIFGQSLQDMLKKAPENITVHTLAIKRASAFGIAQKQAFWQQEQVELALEQGADQLKKAGYAPYYLYRQKYMAGNMENTGYAKPGCLCRYNIDMMEEGANILSFGAGAISKRLFGRQNRIERVAAPKDIATYLSKYPKLAEEKQALFY